MTIPLLAYFYIMSTKRWIRAAIAGSILLCAVSALGTYSRGGLLAIIAMSAFLWLKAKSKLWLGLVVVLLGLGFYSFMPSKWEERMDTISTYEEDRSALGRIKTWTMLTNLALDRPLVGGGFEPYTTEVFRRYLPDYDRTHSAHSIYFQVLGEHGFVGLALFIVFWMLTWQLSRRIIKHTKNDPQSKWAYWLAAMIQVSLIGYFVGGMFLNLAYWDMPYFLMIALVVTWHVLRSQSAEPTNPSALRPDLERVRYPARSPPMPRLDGKHCCARRQQMSKEAYGRDRARHSHQRPHRRSHSFQIYHVKSVKTFEAERGEIVAQPIKREPIDRWILRIIGNGGPRCDGEPLIVSLRETRIPTVQREIEFALNRAKHVRRADVK